MTMHPKQMPLFVMPPVLRAALHERSSTFVDNMVLPIHRWFRFSAGFSAQWVEQEVRRAQMDGEVRLLDPFAGAGTAVIEGERCEAPTIGLEAHPFLIRVARAKLAWRESPAIFVDFAGEVLRLAQTEGGDGADYAPLILKCFPQPVLEELDALRRAWERLRDESPASELTWLAVTAILRACSPAGTAQWQYVLPNKKKAKPLQPYQAYHQQVSNMAADMRVRTLDPQGPRALMNQDDARQCASVSDGWANTIITSPPYTNNYDYADAARLEMTFWGEVRGWGDLHHKVRRLLIRSCSQHVSADRDDLERLLDDPNLEPIIAQLRPVCQQLAEERLHHGGKKAYHLMVAAYFSDLASVWKALRRVTAPGGRACFVVGDSAPYGIHVPVDEWLGELAVAAGFRSFRFEKTRDRNVKWLNRKHRVPLHEGRLWVEG